MKLRHRRPFQLNSVIQVLCSEQFLFCRIVFRFFFSYSNLTKVESFSADFANRFPGGGTLDGGCVQEEILFVIKPECLISMLNVALLGDRDSFLVENAQQFSNYSGYGRAWKYAGECRDDFRKCIIVGIDASVNRFRLRPQFEDPLFTRDILKCISGISGHEGMEFATGNFGCGAFGGDKHLKAFQQIIACSSVGSAIMYCTFGDANLVKKITAFAATFQGSTVGDLMALYRRLLQENDYIAKETLLDLFIKSAIAE